jgi:hypothetical protein
VSLSELYGVEFSALFGVVFNRYGRDDWASEIGPQGAAGSVSSSATFRGTPGSRDFAADLQREEDGCFSLLESQKEGE